MKLKLNKEQKRIVSAGAARARTRIAKARIMETVSQKLGLSVGSIGLGLVPKDEYDIAPGETTVTLSTAIVPMVLGYGSAFLMGAGNVAAGAEGLGDSGLSIGLYNMTRKRRKADSSPVVTSASTTAPTDTASGAMDEREQRAFEAGVDMAVKQLAELERRPTR